MANKESLRIWFVTHDRGRLAGTLMPTRRGLFDPLPPSAFGDSEAEVMAELERRLVAMAAGDDDDPARYLWTEQLTTRRVDVDVHPEGIIQGRAVVGARKLPLRLTYAYSELATGAFRIVLPRFGWQFYVEELAIASDVIRHAVATALLGSEPGSIYDFRHDGPEYVLDWAPDLLSQLGRPPAASERGDEPAVLSVIAEEWVAKLERGQLPPVVGADPVFETARQLLERDTVPSLLLVGPPGCGKTAFVRRIAGQFLARARGKQGTRRRLFATSADRIVAGMVYLGMWQERVLGVIEELSGEDDVLYVDRLPELLHVQPGGGTIADLLGPPIEASELAVIAECDDSELRWCRERAPRLVDQFHLIRLPEPPLAAVLELAATYQRRRGARSTLHPQATRRLVSHLAAFRPDTAFPGKVFRFLDWLNQDTADGAPVEIHPRDVSAAFSRYSGVPTEILSDDVVMTADDIAAALRRSVIGQDNACVAAGRVLARLKAGVQDPEQPVGTLLFVGPTGVGKTELARQLAAYLFGDEARLVRLDMGEYMAPGSSQRMLEVGPGVTGLAERIRRQPLSVVLLDEIEKAHPEVFDLLLGVLGEGRLSDAGGRLVDFRMTLILMTSNLGGGERTPGFGDATGADHLRAVRQHFRPEFLGRVDAVVTFRSLARGDIERIVDLELDRASRRIGLRRRGISLRLSSGGRSRLVDLGFDARLGARPLKRVIEERVVTPIAIRLAGDPDYRDRVVSIVAVAGGPDDIAV